MAAVRGPVERAVEKQFKAQQEAQQEWRAAIEQDIARLVSDLEVERAQSRMLKQQLEEQTELLEEQTKAMGDLRAETDRLRGELDDKRRADAEQVRALSELVSAIDRSASVESESIRSDLRSEVEKQAMRAGRCEAQVAANREAHESAMKKLDEDHTRRRDDDQQAVAAMIERVHEELTTSLTVHRGAVDTKFAAAAVETERLTEGLRKEMQWADLELWEGIRVKDEAAAAARATEKEERCTADSELHVQVRELSQLARNIDRSAKSATESLRSEFAKDAARREEQAEATMELVRANERSATSKSEAIRSDLDKYAASWDADMVTVKEQIGAAASASALELALSELKDGQAKHAASCHAETTATMERVGANDRSARAELQSIHAELKKQAKQAARRDEEMTALSVDLRELHKEGILVLDRTLRSWADEAISRGRAEDELRVALSLERVHAELTSSLDDLHTKVTEAIVPLGEPGALDSLREAIKLFRLWQRTQSQHGARCA